MSVTSELLERLRRHYIKPGEPLPGGVFVPEVGLNGLTHRRCDAIYVGFTSTSGRLLVGHELKVSRGDWLHELDQPGKANRWADECHAWYVVTPSTAIVHPDELPNGWGLLIPSPRSKVRMAIARAATVHQDRVPSWLIVRSIMARVDTLQAAAAAAAATEAQEKAEARLEERVDVEVARRQGAAGRAAQLLAEIEDALQVDLIATTGVRDRLRIDAGELRAAINLVRSRHRLAGRYSSLARTAESLRQVADDLAATQELLDELTSPSAAAPSAAAKAFSERIAR